MPRNELWMGRVEVLTPPTDFGETKAFTNVVTCASDAEGFSYVTNYVFEKYGCSLLGVEECGPVSAWKNLSEDVIAAIEDARDNPKACIYTTFHYYPSKPL